MANARFSVGRKWALACALNIAREFLIDLESGDCVAATTRERLDALEKAVFAPQSDVAQALTEETRKPSPAILAWLWAERAWVIPTAVAIALVVIPGSFGLAYYVAGLEIDKHVDARLVPVRDDINKIHSDIQTINGEVRELKGMLSVLHAPQIVQKLSKLPPDQLKAHKDELEEIKDSLAAAPRDTPGLWPAGFQIITLLSQAVAQLETIGKQPITEFSNVSIAGVGRGGLVSGRNVLLKNTIQSFIFRNSVIHFDPSVHLINTTFENCVFILPADPNPPQNLQKIGQTLLASDLSKVTINS